MTTSKKHFATFKTETIDSAIAIANYKLVEKTGLKLSRPSKEMREINNSLNNVIWLKDTVNDFPAQTLIFNEVEAGVFDICYK